MELVISSITNKSSTIGYCTYGWVILSREGEIPIFCGTKKYKRLKQSLLRNMVGHNTIRIKESISRLIKLLCISSLHRLSFHQGKEWWLYCPKTVIYFHQSDACSSFESRMMKEYGWNIQIFICNWTYTVLWQFRLT